MVEKREENKEKKSDKAEERQIRSNTRIGE
jgi:hypothetical protein